MKKGFCLLIVALSILSLAFPIMAQDDTQVHTFEDSKVSITFPADWDSEVQEDGSLQLFNDEIFMIVFPPAVLASEFDFETADSGTEALTVLVEADEADIEVIEVGDREVARYDYVLEDDDNDTTIFVLPIGDASFGLVDLSITSDDVEGAEEIALGILETFKESGGGGLTLNLDTLNVSDAFCTVSTSEPNTVELRVGPGTNRTVISFLPANVEFSAQGQTTADDDTVWFRLDKEEAAPGKAVNETWINAATVDKEGNCDDVPDAAAPPIIPITSRQPTPVPADPNTPVDPNSPTDEAPVAAVDASGAIAPTRGTWFQSFSTGSVFCTGLGSANYDSGIPSYSGLLTGGGASGIVFDGLFLSFVGNNTYETSQMVPVEGRNIPARLTVTLTSANSATGSLGFVVDSCTLYVPMTMNFTG